MNKIVNITILTLFAVAFVSCCQINGQNLSFNDNILFNFEKRDTIQNNDTIRLRSFFQFDYGNLILINTFNQDSLLTDEWGFNLKSYLGLSVVYNNKTFSKIIGLNYEYCENNFCVFSGDSIDNIEGFNPLILENNLTRIIILEGYPYECNGYYCNAGSILVLKFSDKELQRIYLFGIDKTVHSLSNIKGEFLPNDSFILHLFGREQKRSTDLIFNEKIKLLNKGKKHWELGLYCIK